ncbi:AAA family ATPase [Noviherbaspirillum aerium]|uniref:AAA family ATPase n=1 Tax=Noviherbaspirillum aerium TaxID=2588497 RepID=UPI00124D3B77|nr:AAA family ATPase [Noviherbaspirillum aerium]
MSNQDSIASAQPEQPTRFNIFTELDAWAAGLETWQQCALSKLICQQTLSDADLTTIFDEFLWDRGLAPAPEQRCAYEMQAPQAQPQDTAPLRLTSVDNVVGVNALTPGQQLQISPQLTVIYGPNGSGKSGYARILKASCFTRSKQLSILGNINLTAAERLPVSAVFNMSDGSVQHLTPGTPNKVLRDNFAVFDSSCIRVHTDDKKAFVVTPYLFDVFPRMVEVITEVNNRLKELKRSRMVNLDVFRLPDGKSEVAALLNNLSAKSNRARLIELGTFIEQDAHRVAQIEHDIEQLKKSDPAELIKKKSSALADLTTLDTKLDAAVKSLSVDATAPVANTIAELQGLRQQAKLLSTAAFAQEPLQPMGTSGWKNLLTAALAFNSEAYPGHAFPTDHDAARCVLCQQQLQPDAKARLQRFQQFMTSDLERKITVSMTALTAAAKKITNVDLALFSADSTLRRTADELAPDLSPEVDRLLGILQSRKDVIQAAVKVEAPFTVPDAKTSAFKQIRSLQERLTEEINTFKTKDVAQIIKQLQTELMLLQERKVLAGHLPHVLSAMDHLFWLERANKTPQVSPRAVTDRQKQLMTKLVGTGFREKFHWNCAELGVSLPLDFKFRGNDGEANRQLEFDTVGGEEANLSEVLSEGEQTAVALADFLTEVALNERSVGVVFDDPVSSMDHVRKESIAKRLVQEAKHRQVIIFTHDILFSHHLANEAEMQGNTFTFFGRTVSKNHDGDVGCIDYLVFPHTHYEGEALKRAEDYLHKAKALTGAAQRDYLEKGCGALRTAYEDFIQKQLFADVVRRWRENILFKLSKVYIPDTIGGEVDARMGMLSRYIDAHSHSETFHELPLTVDRLMSEVAQHKDIVARYKAAKKAWEKTQTDAAFG